MTVEGPESPAGVLEVSSADSTDVAGISLKKLQKMSPGTAVAAAAAAGGLGGEDSMRTSISSPTSAAKRGEQAVKRNLVAKWIMDMTRQPVPYSTDQDFRSGLRDGIVLCHLLNKLKPGTITQVVDENLHNNSTGEVIQTMENVTNFLQGVQALGVPADYLFDVSDIEDTGPGDRPRVVACLMALKRLSEGKGLTGDYSTPARNPLAGFQARRATYHFASVRNGVPLQAPTEDFSFEGPGGIAGGEGGMDQETPPLKQSAGKGVQAAVGVTRLMQQCTTMLRERMWSDAPSARSSREFVAQTPTPPRGISSGTPEGALEAMGPVLESVLGSLTQEYEKRLLSKDHELKGALDVAREAQERSKTLQTELDLQKAAASAAMQKAAAVQLQMETSMAEVESEETAAAVAEVRAELADKELEVARLRAEMAAAEEEAGGVVRRAQAELEEAVERLESLAGIEDAYKSVCDENRELYNTVQDLRGSIRVFCRVRPLGKTGDQSESCLDVADGEIAAYQSSRDGRVHRKIFQFDNVFAEASSQDHVYAETSPLVRSVLDGYNVCIFAYGQTGSGKTHTMSGTDVSSLAGRGINYRALDDLFMIADQRSQEWEYSISVQMLEIYNEQLRDLLLHKQGSKTKPGKLDIRMCEQSGRNVPDAIQEPVRCTEDILEIMARGSRNRHVGQTAMNERSSRSHQVLTVMVEGRSNVTGVHSHACLNLIDLAGSERVGRSEATGVRLDEAKCINKSLSALGDVMSALASCSSHVPYRNSKLTQLLQDSLGGQAKTMMFMHIAPESSSYGETVSTLGFGTRVSQVTLGAAKQNREGAELFAARETIKNLEAGNHGVEAERERLRSETAALRKDAADALARERRAESEAAGLRAEAERLRAEVKDAKAAAAAASASAGAVSSRAGSPPMAALKEETTDCDTDGASTPGGYTPPPRHAAAGPLGARKPALPTLNFSQLDHEDRRMSVASESGIPSSSLQTPQPSSKIPASASKIPQRTPTGAVSRAISRARSSTGTVAGPAGAAPSSRRPQTARQQHGTAGADSERPATARKAAAAAAVSSSGSGTFNSKAAAAVLSSSGTFNSSKAAAAAPGPSFGRPAPASSSSMNRATPAPMSNTPSRAGPKYPRQPRPAATKGTGAAAPRPLPKWN